MFFCSVLKAVINLENHEIKEKLHCIAGNIFQYGEVIDPRVELVKQGFDSLDMNDLFLEIESCFGVVIDEHTVEDLNTLDKIETFLLEMRSVEY